MYFKATPFDHGKAGKSGASAASGTCLWGERCGLVRGAQQLSLGLLFDGPDARGACQSPVGALTVCVHVWAVITEVTSGVKS